MCGANPTGWHAVDLARLGLGDEAIKVAPDWAYNVPFFNAWDEAIRI